MEFRVKAKLVTPEDMRRIITRLAHEIIEKNRGVENRLKVTGMAVRLNSALLTVEDLVAKRKNVNFYLNLDQLIMF